MVLLEKKKQPNKPTKQQFILKSDHFYYNKDRYQNQSLTSFSSWQKQAPLISTGQNIKDE